MPETSPTPAEIKTTVEEWFTNVSLDDLYAAKGWPTTDTPRDYDDLAEKVQESLDLGGDTTDVVKTVRMWLEGVR